MLLSIYDAMKKEAVADNYPRPGLVVYRAFDLMTDDGLRVQSSDKLIRVQDAIYTVQSEGYDGTFEEPVKYDSLNFTADCFSLVSFSVFCSWGPL